MSCKATIPERLKNFSLVTAALLSFGSLVHAKQSQTLAIPPDSPRWELEGQAKATEYLGRKSLYLNGGAATLKDLDFRDGVIDVDVATPASRGFFGIQFRVANEGGNAEWVYLRQHKSGAPDAMQYTPVLNTGLTGKFIMDQASPARSLSPKMSGFTCASKWSERKRNFT